MIKQNLGFFVDVISKKKKRKKENCSHLTPKFDDLGVKIPYRCTHPKFGGR